MILIIWVFGEEKENPLVEIREEKRNNKAMDDMQIMVVRIGELSFGFGLKGLFIVAICS